MSYTLMRRVGGGLWPVGEPASKRLRQLPAGDIVAVRIEHRRNAQQVALYWRTLGETVAATRRWRDAAELHAALRIAAGCTETVRLIDGRKVLVPRSTAFDVMTEAEAETYFSAALRLVNEIDPEEE
jgi:hypothetical protein